jgi:HEAT repeat protein
LVTLVENYSHVAIEVLTDLIIGEQVNAAVASEALRWIGHIEDPSSHLERRRFLERSLNHSSAYVRDGAALGLSFMDDPGAIPSLKRAVEREIIEELRHDLQQILGQLQDTQLEHMS